MNIQNKKIETAGVGPTSGSSLDPRQQKFIMLYCESGSLTFGNCYKSALKAGYSEQTARNITHNRPQWYSEILGKMNNLEPEHLVAKLTDIINNPLEATTNQLKAINILMKHKGMFPLARANTVNINRLNIQNVLD